MGDELSRKPAMKQISWQLVHMFSAILDQSEREAVLGDFAESAETGSKALRDTLGLVIRRQAAIWADWRPWLTLAVLIIPLGMVLSVLSCSTAAWSAVYTWMYGNNWDWTLARNSGFWYVLRESAMLMLVGWLTLVCCSWTAGFVLGHFSRGIVRINGVLFLLMLAFGEIEGAPRYLAYYWQYLHRAFHLPSLPDPNAPVVALTFYRVIFPLIVQAVLVAAPAMSGMRHGIQTTGLRRPYRTILLTAAVLTIAMMMLQMPGFVLLLNA